MKRYQTIHKRKKIGEGYVLEQRKRMLLGIMDVLIIQWIKKTPLSGQDMMNKLKEEFKVSLGPGTMYPILFNLRDKKMITSTKIEKKKLYHLTPKGKKLSKSVAADYRKIQKEIKIF